MAEHDLTIPALDDVALAATLFEPPRTPSHAVVVSGATAAPRGFYRAFAQWLAAQGAVAITYDYRGTGGTPASLRASNARMRDWGTLDFPGVLAWMRAAYAPLPVCLVGHSFGGHGLLMAPNAGEVTRSALIASQSGYWRLIAPHDRPRVWALLNVFAPLSMRLLGYLPGSSFGLGEDMASGIMREWRRWCNLPNYFYDDPSMTDVLANAPGYTAPTLMLGLADDAWATPAAIDSLARHFAHVPLERRTLEPRAFGLGHVGHMGFFRSRNGAALWPVVGRYLGLMEEAA